MNNLIKMDLFRQRKNKSIWIFSTIIFVLAFIAPIIEVIFANLIVKVAESEPQEVYEAAKEAYDIMVNTKTDFSWILRASFGGLMTLSLFPLLYCATYFYSDISHGYIKNLAGQFPRRSMLAVSKYIVVLLPCIIMMAAGIVGNTIGHLITKGINMDCDVGMGVLAFLLKILMLWALASVLLLFAVGLNNKTLAIVIGVVFGTGMMSVFYLPLDLLFDKVFKLDFKVEKYVPDMLFRETDFDFLAALISSVVIIAACLIFTSMMTNKRDVN